MKTNDSDMWPSRRLASHTYKGMPLNDTYKPICKVCGHAMRFHL